VCDKNQSGKVIYDNNGYLACGRKAVKFLPKHVDGEDRKKN
jgi:hypothetical protein